MSTEERKGLEGTSSIKPLFFYYNESEWNRIGCGPLPAERDISLLTSEQIEEAKALADAGGAHLDSN